MCPSQPNRRDTLKLVARFAGTAPLLTSQLPASVFQTSSPRTRVFDVRDYGVAGDGRTNDTESIQRATDAASGVGKAARVLIPGGQRYLVGTLQLKSGIDFHLADDAELIVSTNRKDYSSDGVITADNAQDLRISGTGKISGRAREFMVRYDKPNEWWLPADWRPKMFILTRCDDLEVRDITFSEAPNWGLHMLGCERVLVQGLNIQNLLDVPNCDGIDPDHCRKVEISSCKIISGDDAIVVKTSRQPKDFGPAADILVRDCEIETQDSGLKIGTETTSDIYNVTFQNCSIKSSSRGLCIQLRDEADVHDVVFQDVNFVSQFHSDPWWGRGEAISFTALPRTPGTKTGQLRDVRVQNVTGRAENSVRICGTPAQHVRNIVLDHVSVTLDRWTNYRGGVFDNRPTTAEPAIEPHDTPGFSIRYADYVTLRNCEVNWYQNRPEYFSDAIETVDAPGFRSEHFRGKPAHKETGTRQKTSGD